MASRHPRRANAVWRDRDRENRLTTITRPTHHFLSDDMWALSDNRNFEWFCLRAHLVDDFEPLTDGALALAVHDAYGNVAVTDDDFDTVDTVSVKFQTLEVGHPPLWRCDWERSLREPFTMGLAGAYNRQLLTEFQRADVLFLVTVQLFEIWQMDTSSPSSPTTETSGSNASHPSATTQSRDSASQHPADH